MQRMQLRFRTGLVVAWGAVACASAGIPDDVAPFPTRTAPVWEDPDRAPFRPAPRGRFAPVIWDGADHGVLRPITRGLALRLPTESLNVNAWDEVPNSSWFTNRMSVTALTPGEVAQGPCLFQPEPALPWTVVSGKGGGSNPGFEIVDARGVRALVKVDEPAQPERATSADLLGSLIFHSAGYFVPCNRVHFVRESDLVLKPGAQMKRPGGKTAPLDRARVSEILRNAHQVGPGLRRVSVTEYVEGAPIGIWRYEGTESRDLNDVMPHQRRRELRGMRLLAAWTDHVDAREGNTLSSWIPRAQGSEFGHVRHYRIDFGDMLGLLNGPVGVPERFGHVSYLSLSQVAADFLTLGLIDRPWHDKEFGPAGRPLGYWRAEPFDPETWSPAYPNPAFLQASELDHAWMARILAGFGPAHIDAMVDRLRLSQPGVDGEIRRILKARRMAILERYLTRRSPLAVPEAAHGQVCVTDLAVRSGIRSAASRQPTHGWWSRGARPASVPVPSSAIRRGRYCVPVPDAAPGTYRILAWSVRDLEHPTGPLWVHTVTEPSGSVRIVGLERPAFGKTPRW